MFALDKEHKDHHEAETHDEMSFADFFDMPLLQYSLKLNIVYYS